MHMDTHMHIYEDTVKHDDDDDDDDDNNDDDDDDNDNDEDNNDDDIYDDDDDDIMIIVITCICQFPMIMTLIRLQGADIELCNSKGMTPLMLAAREGDAILCDVSSIV
ncbi:hypothetical protein KUTeg_001977 [Tegillarca granosa]|uniref:Uncharacterized protein n=1 Tax=Tegillarca granosa TaxID=220873 RepID=A0ABQ9FT36_TEGGR|nr:hypothetical protein KUTeg_001977 [Tegillarca granosa]